MDERRARTRRQYCITTSLSYSNIVISHKMDNEVSRTSNTTADESSTGTDRKTDRETEWIREQQKHSWFSEQVLDENIADVSFMKPDSSIVPSLKKHRRQILKNAEDKDKVTERVFNSLKENGIPITNSTLMNNENRHPQPVVLLGRE